MAFCFPLRELPDGGARHFLIKWSRRHGYRSHICLFPYKSIVEARLIRQKQHDTGILCGSMCHEMAKRAAFHRWLSEEAGEPDVSHLPRMRPVSQFRPL